MRQRDLKIAERFVKFRHGHVELAQGVNHFSHVGRRSESVGIDQLLPDRSHRFGRSDGVQTTFRRAA